jgi:hypothetical protein
MIKGFRKLYSRLGSFRPKPVDSFTSLDYLIFSSHKSGTQTLKNSLLESGFNCQHAHMIENIGLKPGSLSTSLQNYYQKRGQKLPIISVFRDPLDRHISSFFQWYGSAPLWRKQVSSEKETIIYQKRVQELQERFIYELTVETLHGLYESIDVLREELGLAISELPFDQTKMLGLYEGDTFELYLLRFDQLFANFQALMLEITGSPVRMVKNNMGEQKWYAAKYREFKNTLRLNPELIYSVYNNKASYLELFYPNDHQNIIEQRVNGLAH